MMKEKAVFYAALQALTDFHQNIDNIFEGEDAEFAQELMADYEDKQNQYDTESMIETYKELAKEALHTIERRKQVKMKFTGEDWASGYAEIGEIIKDENNNE